MKRVAILALALLLPAGTAFAHHPFAQEFDANAPVTLTGKVTRVDWSEPHVMIYADVKNKDGKMESWGFEAAAPEDLAVKGWKMDTLKPGDSFTVHAYKAKTEANKAGARTITLADGKTLNSAPNDGGPKT